MKTALPDPPIAHGKRLLALLFLGFLSLFLARFVASFWIEGEDIFRPASPQAVRDRGSWLDFVSSEYRKDYANNAASIEFDAGGLPDGTKLGVLEVYTREARVGAVTDAFDRDVAAAMAAVEQHGANIRIEQAEGVKPNRTLRVVIRAPVDQFEPLVAELQEVGDLQSSSVVKEDKSEEARQRFAERDALRTYVDSLAKLRESEGEVGDLVQLESKIQEVEQQIRALNVALGEFVKEESYNNVNYSLAERIDYFVDDEDYPVTARAVAAFVWTVQWYFLAVCLLGLCWLTWASVAVLRGGRS